jgi:hypothetical protein
MIVYANLCRTGHQKNGLEKLMRKQFPEKTEYLYSLEDLQKRLRASIYNIDIMVIHVGCESPVPGLLEFQNDLKELNIILIFSETASNEQVAQLLKLYPRYMTSDAADETIISLLEQRLSNKIKSKAIL